VEEATCELLDEILTGNAVDQDLIEAIKRMCQTSDKDEKKILHTIVNARNMAVGHSDVREGQEREGRDSEATCVAIQTSRLHAWVMMIIVVFVTTICALVVSMHCQALIEKQTVRLEVMHDTRIIPSLRSMEKSIDKNGN